MAEQHRLELTLRCPPERAWRFVADTNRADAAAGLPAITYRDDPQADGTSRRFFSYRLKGLAVQGEEHPFTWEFPRRFEVRRDYLRGPFVRTVHECLVEAITHPDGAPGSQVVHLFSFEGRGLLGKIFSFGFGREVLPKMRAFFVAEDAREAAQAGQTGAFPAVVRSGPAPTVHRQAIERLAAEATEVFDGASVARIATLLTEASDLDVERLRPRTLARLWDVDEEEVLNSFLAATSVGLTRLRWDVICPHCRGDKQNLDSLGAIEERAFCPACNIDFDVDLDRALEAVFVPHPKAREVEVARYCLGGPGVTPHVVAQTLLPPGQRWSPVVTLAAGRTRLRFSGTEEWRWLVAGREPAEPVVLRVTDAGVLGAEPAVQAGAAASFTVHNESARPVLVVLEDVSWARDALPAGRLVADQRFRDLFSNEMLAPGVRLSVENVTIVFTDLVGSTAMYGALGDARAFNLVWHHFDVLKEVVAQRRGAVVKTIGDAIMAAFMDPTDALLAAVDLHERLAAHLRAVGHDYPAALKVGMHVGPAIAVTLNERLDYFGSTVNLAARVEGHSVGDDIVLSARTADQAGAIELLAPKGWVAEAFAGKVKGFAEPVPMVRFKRAGAG